MKRVLTIQDISCIGKCSLTVALPIISAFGIETAVMPTAVLSTHTAFKNFTFRDLTDDLEKIKNHWENENFNFDAVYTGYLGSKRQIQIVSDIFGTFKGGLKIVDPAMADNGVLYKGFTLDFAKEMAKLCEKADIVVPNMTEACFMLDIPYIEKGYNEDYIKDLLKKLTENGTKIAIITGVSFEDDKLGAYGYDSTTNTYFSYYRERLLQSFHGTGDIFASALTGAYMLGNNNQEALSIAVDFTVESMLKTMENPNHNWYGVEFERAFPYLIKRIAK